ncbi:EF-P 5-aminopentanol modification-associated protein YfmF [Enterococcus casseliflavus]|uniref:EF-P 5-aminopentanol modification-associated protein YfmF n=1 Tax=Enterococcus casseliflavus TaxID=37734 RepID=UPI001883F5BA|nr:insulinase family protein [Enterococcus casseliflavus]MBE9908968.1 insulinase family protein [Enterococcus casseliflavus]
MSKSIEISSSSHNGMNVIVCSTEKFKTITISLVLTVPLKADKCGIRALIPYVLTSSTKNCPDKSLVNEKLDNLYGADLQIEVNKKGENQLLTFRMQIISDQYSEENAQLLASAIMFLHEIVYDPYVNHDGFLLNIVEAEKKALKKKVKSIVNDQSIYASIRLIEEVFEGSPRGVFALGNIEDIDRATPLSVYEAYMDLLKESKVEMFVVGRIKENKLVKVIQSIFVNDYVQNFKTTRSRSYNKSLNNIKTIHEISNTQQSQLLVGYQTNVTIKDSDFEACRVANAIFGRFPSSKLFQSIREKEAIAYFILSQLEINNGILMVIAGINVSDYDRTLKLILKQEEAMKLGEFTPEEVEKSKVLLKNLLLEAYDTPMGIIDICMQLMESGKKIDDVNNQIKRISEVTKRDIVRVVKNWRLDTVFFLKEGD